MHYRLLLAAVLCSFVATAAPAHAASTPPRPTSVSYDFAHGRVAKPRTVRLALDLNTEDPRNTINNGDYKVGFQAKMSQYIIQAGDQTHITQIATAFNDVSTFVNGNPVLNAIPPTYDPRSKAPNEYVIFVNRNGQCDCTKLPALIYAVVNNAPRFIHLGDLFPFLHPYLPQSQDALQHGWTSRMAFGLTPKHSTAIDMASRLVLQNGSWVVSSSLSKPLHLTMPARQWKAEWGKAWPDPLPYGGPVTVSGSISITSTLTLGQPDGINVVPMGASKNTPSHLCQNCTGYTMPLDGVENLHLYYSQNGVELYRLDEVAHLTIGIALN